MYALSAGELWEFVRIIYKEARADAAILLYSTNTTQCRNFFWVPGSNPTGHFCAAPQNCHLNTFYTPFIISTSRLTGMLGSIYTYGYNICPILKRNQNATFGAHRLDKKTFPHWGSNPGPKKINRLL